MFTKSEMRILLPTDKEAILRFERDQLAMKVADPMEREMSSWTARWREEALDHYLSQGWSYGLYDQNSLNGYILCKPILFFRGLTQALWVEHVTANSAETLFDLIEMAYRWARDKHFQCLFFEADENADQILTRWKQAKLVEERFIELKCAKY